MYKAEVEIELIVPYKQNRITDDVINEISGNGGKKKTPQEITNSWPEKAYQDKKGYYIPRAHLQGTINRGMCSPTPIKCNRVKFTKEKAKGTIFVQDNGYLFDGKTKPVPEKDINAMPGDMNKLVLQIRPRFKAGLKAKFELFIAHDWLTLDALKDGIEQAGASIGIGSNRPIFGRFIVKGLNRIS